MGIIHFQNNASILEQKNKIKSTFPFEKHVFVLKSQVALNELELNSIDIMCSLIINKYINRFGQYKSLLLTDISSFHNIFKNYFKTLQTQNY